MNNASVETRQQRRFRARQEKKGPPKPQRGAFKRALEAFRHRAEALKAASALTPLLAKLALMELAGRLGQYKSRGHGRGTPPRRFGNRPGAYRPHQGAQERIRRTLGGWAFNKRMSGLTKRQALEMLATKEGQRKYARLRWGADVEIA